MADDDLDGSRVRVACLGGPLLVCGGEAFAGWGGAVFDGDGELDPGCDFARANAELCGEDDEFEAVLTRFGGRAGVVWQMDGEGTAEIVPLEDGFLILRLWAGHTADAADHLARAIRIDGSAVADLELPDRTAAVVWAPVPANDLEPFTAPDGSGTAVRLHQPHLRNIGALLPILAGTYRVTCGEHVGAEGRYAPAGHRWNGTPQDGDWSYRWIRFTHRDAAAQG